MSLKKKLYSDVIYNINNEQNSLSWVIIDTYAMHAVNSFLNNR